MNYPYREILLNWLGLLDGRSLIHAHHMISVYHDFFELLHSRVLVEDEVFRSGRIGHGVYTYVFRRAQRIGDPPEGITFLDKKYFVFNSEVSFVMTIDIEEKVKHGEIISLHDFLKMLPRDDVKREKQMVSPD